MNVLTSWQRAFLARFFSRGNSRAFYLTGGTALAEFYLEHRLSQDIDLFTQDQEAWRIVEDDVSAAAEEIGATLDFRSAKEGDELHRAFLRVPGEPDLKIDIVRDAPPHLGEVQIQSDGVIVDSPENIAVGKLLALYGRAYPRDFVDLYFLLESGWDFKQLVALGKEKDPGLIEFYLAGMIRQVAKIELKDLPRLLKPLDLEKMKAFFLKLADGLASDEITDN